MKYLKPGLLAFGLAALLWGCAANKDAIKFCDCYQRLEANEQDPCEDDMEALEAAFKKDEKRYEAFREAAMKKCPEAAKYINRMN